MCIPEAMIICLTQMNIYPERAVKNLYIIFSQNRNAAGMQSLQSMRLKLSGLYPPHISPYNIPCKFPAHMLFPPFHLISGIRLQTDYTPEKPMSSHRKAFAACPYRLSRVTRKPFSHVMKNFWRTSISQSSDIQQIILTRKNQPIQRQDVFRLSLRNSQRLYIIWIFVIFQLYYMNIRIRIFRKEIALRQSESYSNWRSMRIMI